MDKNFFKVAAFYKFTQLSNLSDLQEKFLKLKNEIVSIGNELANPQKTLGTYVQPEEWNELIADDDVLILDTRNTYEFSIGTFKNLFNQRQLILENFLNGLRA
jgi:UPF0176 protein